MECPTCGGPTFDNRQQNAQRIANGEKPRPDFKCKDRDCGWVKWGPRPKKGTTARANGGAKWTWPQLSQLYERSLLVAKKHVTAALPNASPADVIAAGATVFIAASRDGVKAVAPKPKVEEPPPPEPQDEEPDDSDDLPW